MNTHPTLRVCPYKGLQPFTSEDRDFFFGRDKEEDIIASNIEVSPLTIFYGASGVGKSSVLMAGVLPRLRKDNDGLVIFFRDWQRGDLLVALKKEVLKVLQDKTGKVEVDDALPFADFLIRCTQVAGVPIRFILDQFEEYFLYHGPPQATAQGGNGYRRQEHFDIELARSVNHRDLRVNFLLSLREDSLSKLDRLQPRIPNLLRNMLRLEYLDRDEARVAVKKPIAAYNRLHLGDPPVRIEPQLVEKLLDQVEAGQVSLNDSRPASAQGPIESKRIETPFLQIVLERLWETEAKRWEKADRAEVHWMRLETLDALGGAERIIHSHLDEVMSRLGDLAHKQKIPISAEDALTTAASVFRFLVTPSDSKIAHTAKNLAAFAELPADKEQHLEDILELLASQDVRILRRIEPSPGRTEGARYEIYHDVLAPAILAWRDQYIKDQKVVRAEQQAEEQRERARLAANSARRFRRLSYALGVVCIIALVAVVVAARYVWKSQILGDEGRKLKAEGQMLRQQGFHAQQLAKAANDKAFVEQQKARDLEAAANALASDARKQKEQADIERLKASEALAFARAQQAKADEATGISRLTKEAMTSYQRHDKERAVKAYLEVVPYYQRAHDKCQEARIHASLGDIYREAEEEELNTSGKDDYREAFTSIDKALKLYGACKSEDVAKLSGEGDAYNTLGIINEKFIDEMDPVADKDNIASYYENAVDRYMKASVKALDLKDLDAREKSDRRGRQNARGKALERLGSILERASQSASERARATKILDKLVSLFEGDDLGGDWKRAAKYANMKLLIATNYGPEYEIASLTKDVAVLYERAQMIPEAIDHYSKAAQLYMQSPQPESHVTAASMLSQSARLKAPNNRTEAITDYHAAFAVYDRLAARPKNPFAGPESSEVQLRRFGYERAAIHQELGKLYSSDNMRAAVVSYKWAGGFYALILREFLGPNPAPGMRADNGDLIAYEATLISLASLTFELGEPQQALQSYNQALVIQQKMKRSEKAAQTLRAIGKIYEAIGDKTKAEESYKQSREIHPQP